MLIERKAINPRKVLKTVSENCLGCADCKGVCAEYTHLIQYSKIMASVREART